MKPLLQHRDRGAVKGLHMDVDACLPLRPAAVECAMCSDACPRSAIEWCDDGARVSAACVECGRCAAVCPTGALAFGGFDAHAEPAAEPGDPTLYLECRRVPVAWRRPGSHVLPCLGSATGLQLLEWMADGRVPVLIDRGWCAECPAGGDRAGTTEDVVADARHDSAMALGVHADSGNAADLGLPRIESAPLPKACALPAPTADGSTGTPMGRRGFFAAFRGGAATVAAAMARPGWTRTRAACRPSATLAARSARRAVALRALAAWAGRVLTGSAFPVLSIHDNCCHEGVCAAACPSGALTIVDDGDTVGLDFRASACIGCGLCEQLCPHHALSLAQAGAADHAANDAAVPLKRHALARCPRCDDEFVARDDTSLCSRCVMARDQARNLFGSLLTRSADRDAATSR